MAEDWQERWREGRIGWHQSGGHPGLQRHWPWTGRRVLVPLCGKAVDLRWLAERGNAVVGVELSPLAVESFFAEQGLQYTIQGGSLPAYRAMALDITRNLKRFDAADPVKYDFALCRLGMHHNRSQLTVHSTGLDLSVNSEL